jgi:hypothetical protein
MKYQPWMYPFLKLKVRLEPEPIRLQLYIWWLKTLKVYTRMKTRYYRLKIWYYRRKTNNLRRQLVRYAK